jgi:HAD superfamily hydrolase (TIGR01549 family)
MTEKHPLQAVFFDFDGVIVDSNRIKTEAFRTLFKDYDQATVAKVVAYHQRHGGISRVEKIRYVHEHFLNQPLTGEELDRWAGEFSQLVVEKVVGAAWIDGAKEFLESSQAAWPMFLISGTPEDELRHIVERRKISGYFQAILGSPVGKPYHIRHLLADYRLNPSHCIFVGDALTDFNAARETGLHFIGIRGEVAFPEGTTVLPDCRGLRQAIAAHFVW